MESETPYNQDKSVNQTPATPGHILCINLLSTPGGVTPQDWSETPPTRRTRSRQNTLPLLHRTKKCLQAHPPSRLISRTEIIHLQFASSVSTELQQVVVEKTIENKKNEKNEKQLATFERHPVADPLGQHYRIFFFLFTFKHLTKSQKGTVSLRILPPPLENNLLLTYFTLYQDIFSTGHHIFFKICHGVT